VRAGELKPGVVVGSEHRSAEDGQQHRARCNEQRDDHGCFLSCRADSCDCGEAATVAGRMGVSFLTADVAELVTVWCAEPLSEVVF